MNGIHECRPPTSRKCDLVLFDGMFQHRDQHRYHCSFSCTFRSLVQSVDGKSINDGSKCSSDSMLISLRGVRKSAKQQTYFSSEGYQTTAEINFARIQSRVVHRNIKETGKFRNLDPVQVNIDRILFLGRNQGCICALAHFIMDLFETIFVHIAESRRNCMTIVRILHEFWPMSRSAICTLLDTSRSIE